MKRRRVVEWPTWGVALAVYSSWLALTWHSASLPWWVVLTCGGLLIAWHGSLQHEAVHGHPTRSARFNALLAGVPLGVWLPYSIYRESHLAHHRSGLTDPHDDPESYYTSQESWQRTGRLRRAFLWVHQTLAGRLLLGPVHAWGRLLWDEAALLARGDRSHLAAWALHLLGVAAVFAWVSEVCGIPAWAYLLLFVYPGLSLTLLRSYAEHQPSRVESERTAIVEAGPLFSLLYLNNNLHVVHHDQPGLPWYALPARYWETREEVLQRNGGYLIPGYRALLRYVCRPKEAPVHSLGGGELE